MNIKPLAELIKSCEKARALDIGCGEGKLANELRNGEAFGIEISHRYADEVQKNDVNVIMGDIDTRLPFKDANIDIVTLNQVIERVNKADNFKKKCYPFPENVGIYAASIPNLDSPHNILSLVLRWQPFVTASHKHMEWIRYALFLTIKARKVED